MVVVFPDFDSQKEILLIKRKSVRKEYVSGHPFTISSKWGLPGGTQEPGETLIQTAKREVEEETGYFIEVDPRLEYEEPRRYHCAITRCGWVIGGQMKVFKKEIVKVEWFSVKSLPKPKKMYTSHFRGLREILSRKGIYI